MLKKILFADYKNLNKRYYTREGLEKIKNDYEGVKERIGHYFGTFDLKDGTDDFVEYGDPDIINIRKIAFTVDSIRITKKNELVADIRLMETPNGKTLKRLKDKIIDTVVNKVQPIILTIMPTGSGKTVLAMEVITDMFRFYEPIKNKKINIGWVVRSKELCEQSLQSFQRIWKQKGDHPVYCERYFGKFSKLESINQSKITFASFDLISSRINNPEVQQFLESVDLIVIDEVHFSEADTYSEIIYNYKKLKENYKIIPIKQPRIVPITNCFKLCSYVDNFNV